jgi:N-acetylglucosamine kinase-like BadF-type ATPase
MILLAQSSSVKTEWCLVDGHKIIESFISDGINPFFQSRIEISRIIRLQLPSMFFATRLSQVYFYGAGCISTSMRGAIKIPLETGFKAPTVVETNSVGAARALYQREPGIVCILDTESSSCFYDGTSITKNVRSLGYILGDEGSSVSLGKCFLSDCLQDIAPKEIVSLFFMKNKIEADEIVSYIYTSTFPNRILSTLSYFLYENIEHPYVHKLVYNNMKAFLERNIFQYDQYFNYPVCFVGPIAKMYSSILREAAQSIGIYIDTIVESPMNGLVKYHTRSLKITQRNNSITQRNNFIARRVIEIIR